MTEICNNSGFFPSFFLLLPNERSYRGMEMELYFSRFWAYQTYPIRGASAQKKKIRAAQDERPRAV